LHDMVHTMSPMGMPKEIRARAQSHHVLAGRVFLPKHGDFVRELKRQWLAFPRASHDEYVDCVSYAIQHARNVHTIWSALHVMNGRKVGQYSEPTWLRPPTEFELGHDNSLHEGMAKLLSSGNVGPDDIESELQKHMGPTPDFWVF
jgi:hypothetical protein